ncbi:MAG: hypothetical protein AAFN10_10685 [Bacteroidota bacterium]
MKQPLLLLLGLLCFGSTQTQAGSALASPDQITVYVFLHEACLISQYYTLPLRQLHEEYANEQIAFVGLFPNASSRLDKIEDFKATYNIPFVLQIDEDQQKTEAFGASITPEVVVYNETKAQILYKGRIDDAYARVGQRRRTSNSSELKDVLLALSLGQEVQTPHTPAVGCFISKVKPN